MKGNAKTSFQLFFFSPFIIKNHSFECYSIIFIVPIIIRANWTIRFLIQKIILLNTVKKVIFLHQTRLSAFFSLSQSFIPAAPLLTNHNGFPRSSSRERNKTQGRKIRSLDSRIWTEREARPTPIIHSGGSPETRSIVTWNKATETTRDLRFPWFYCRQKASWTVRVSTRTKWLLTEESTPRERIPRRKARPRKSLTGRIFAASGIRIIAGRIVAGKIRPNRRVRPRKAIPPNRTLRTDRTTDTRSDVNVIREVGRGNATNIRVQARRSLTTILAKTSSEIIWRICPRKKRTIGKSDTCSSIITQMIIARNCTNGTEISIWHGKGN